MTQSVFAETEFFMLILVSLILPISIYGYMMWTRSISRPKVFLFSLSLIFISGTNLYLLRRLETMAKASPSLLDHKIFASEISIALYLLPVMFAGIGVNMLSHILISHLADAEKRFDLENE
jgi:hypothetical protein